MKNWPWQKWVGKLWPFALAVGGLVWGLIEQDPAGWYVVGSGIVTGFIQWLLGSFPVKD